MSKVLGWKPIGCNAAPAVAAAGCAADTQDERDAVMDGRYRPRRGQQRSGFERIRSELAPELAASGLCLPAGPVDVNRDRFIVRPFRWAGL